MKFKSKFDPQAGKTFIAYEENEVFYEAHFKDGKNDGDFVLLNDQGQKILEGSWGEGRPNGKVTTWYSSGQKKQEASFLNGQPHGVWKSWYDDGSLMEQREYSQGQEVGAWKTWDSRVRSFSDDYVAFLSEIEKKVLEKSFSLITRHPYYKSFLIFSFAYPMIGSYIFFLLERGVNPNITSLSDAFIWSLNTTPIIAELNTLPVSPIGKILGMALHIINLALICIWIGFIAFKIFARKVMEVAIAELKASRDFGDVK